MAISSPADLPGLHLWFDADAITGLVDGDPVGTWPASHVSDPGDLTQSTASKQPTYRTGVTPSGGPVVRFDGVDDNMVTGDSGVGSPAATIFVVMSMGGEYNAVIHDGVVSNARVWIGAPTASSTTWGAPGLTAASSRPLPLGVVTYRTGSPGTLRRDGVEEASGPTGVVGLRGITLGSRYSNSRFMSGDVAEYLAYQRELTAAEIADVEAYLTAKWMTPSGDTAEGVVEVSHSWAVEATGYSALSGSAEVSHSWTVEATGDDTEPNYGTAEVSHSWTVDAVGINGERNGGTIEVSHSWTVEAVGENGETVLAGWDADLSQQAVIDLTGPDSVPAGPLLIDRAPAVAPETITERPVMRHSPQPVPADFTVSPDGTVHSKGTWAIVEGVLGVPHVWVDGVDITYFRGVPVSLEGIATSEPGGWESASLVLPQVSVFEDRDTATDLTWMRPDAQIESYWVDADGQKVRDADGHAIQRFSGHLVDDGVNATESETATVWECAGDLVASAYVYHHPPITLDETDIGTLIPRALNSVISRRWGTIAEVETGITTSKRGSGDDRVWDYVQELLADAWTTGGRQWTLSRVPGTPRQYALKLKGDGGNTWTVTAATPGLALRLHADHSSRSDAVFGRGVGRDGYAWEGRVWPALLDYDPPNYPNTSAGNTIMPGETDASTDSGDGVSVWQQRTVDLGYDLTVTGVMDSASVAVVRRIQSRMGLLVDGIIGPQTWTGTWEVGVDAAALASLRLPLASRTEVEPVLRAANGAILGDNPDYDPTVIRRERSVDYGVPVRKRVGVRSAELEVERSQTVGWIGEASLKVDPHEGSRHLIAEGDRLVVLGLRGKDVTFHVGKVQPGDGVGEIRLSLDTHARDAMTLASIRRRDHDAAIDPARRPGNVNRKSRMARDLRVEFEGESPAGRIHRRALYAGLWSVFPIPVSEAGQIVKLEATTSGPASEFSLGFFASPVQPSHLLRLVGNPSADSEAWRTRLPELKDHGFIEAWGAGEAMAGHWPSRTGPTTGVLIDTGGWSYHSDHGGWVWVAAWSPVSTFIEGRVYPAPID